MTEICFPVFSSKRYFGTYRFQMVQQVRHLHCTWWIQVQFLAPHSSLTPPGVISEYRTKIKLGVPSLKNILLIIFPCRRVFKLSNWRSFLWNVNFVPLRHTFCFDSYLEESKADSWFCTQETTFGAAQGTFVVPWIEIRPFINKSCPFTSVLPLWSRTH